MSKTLFFLILGVYFLSCNRKIQVDSIFYNGNIYTVNDNFDKINAFALSDGKFVEVGDSSTIFSQYSAKDVIDLKNKTVLPGLIDAHCHFYGLGLQQQRVDLTNTNSFKDVVERIVAFQKEKQVDFITGRGWDQNDWKVKEYPTNDTLNQLFPRIPIVIERIDGHALLANNAAIKLANINTELPVEGGEVLKENGKLTGVFIDAPMALIDEIKPEPTLNEKISALIEAEKICLDLGLTTVDDAGLNLDVINLIDSLHGAGDLKIRVYAMASANKENLNHFIEKGKLKTDRLNVCSFKVYADGALGSRGAALKKPYSDQHEHVGAFVTPLSEITAIAHRIAESDFQMNTHAIGDSANLFILKLYDTVLKKEKGRRWRIEHAQIVSPLDFDYFKETVPSVQPTHATSDMYWAEDRLGKERVKGAYANKKLLEKHRKIALGTDFPVEKVNPMLTFYAAVARKDLKDYPKGGFQMENSLSREETLKGMTIWAAYSNFEEKEKGSIERGKFADFIILNQNIMEVEAHLIPKTKVLANYLAGENQIK